MGNSNEIEIEGQWEPPIEGEIMAIHAALLATGKVLYFDARPPRSEIPIFPITSRVYDPKKNTITGQPIPEWPEPWDPNCYCSDNANPPFLFCSGHTFLSDGRLLVAGGTRPYYLCPPPPFLGLPYTYYFDPWSESWEPATDRSGNPIKMADGRWYPTLILYSDGLVYAFSGYRACPENNQSVINKSVERFDGERWETLDNADLPNWFRSLYPRGHVIPRGDHIGKIFFSSPPVQSGLFDPVNGFWRPHGRIFHNRVRRPKGNSVLMPLRLGEQTAELLVLGGAEPPPPEEDHPYPHREIAKPPEGSTDVHCEQNLRYLVEKIDLALPDPRWMHHEPLYVPRMHPNTVILPDGRLMIIGGNLYGHKESPVLVAEIYDPEEGKFRLIPGMRIPRGYHSTALLLPDGRVWVGGGESPTNRPEENPHTKIEIYKPGYFFDGKRPVILSGPQEIGYGQTFSILVRSGVELARAVLIRPGSTTHAFDFDQRYVEIEIVAQVPVDGEVSVTVRAPNEPNLAPPGYYMLFVLKGKEHSNSGKNYLPSEEAIFVRLT